MAQWLWPRGNWGCLLSSAAKAKAADQALGEYGEKLALAEAVAKGWSPWKRNHKLAVGEIDLALLREVDGHKELLVLEVKTSRRPIAEPGRRWSQPQRRRLWRLAEQLTLESAAEVVQVALVLVVVHGTAEDVTWIPVTVDDVESARTRRV